MTARLLTDGGPRGWPDVLASAPLLLLYKHSPLCGASAAARDELDVFQGAAPDIPLYQVDVIHQRALSNAIADRLDIRHESPQVILICKGTPIWHTSHFRIKAATVIEQVRRAAGCEGRVTSRAGCA